MVLAKSKISGRPIAILFFTVCLWLACVRLQGGAVFAKQGPSLFRGVVVADSPIGIRVVSVEKHSQAFEGDIRPEDIILRVHGSNIGSIDEFAQLSVALKGKLAEAEVIVLRNGAPVKVRVHIYSYPILRAWNIKFVPDYELQFAQPDVGKEYWVRMGRGFESAHNEEAALNAYLNALHNVANDNEVALNAARLYSRLAQKQLRERDFIPGITSLRLAMIMMERLFDSPLTDKQLRSIRDELGRTLEALREFQAPGAITRLADMDFLTDSDG